jgi:predicted MFS family arabinose efflux permease
MLIAPKTEASVYLFACAFGLMWLGTVPLTSGLVGQIFGPRYLATLFGLVMLSHQVGAFFGAWLGGLAFDLAGSYTSVWILAAALGVVAAALHAPIADAPLRRGQAAAT